MAGPNTIMFIRHGEKPGENGPPHGIDHNGEHDPHSLSVRGWTRAGALAGLLARGPSAMHPSIVAPERIIATKATHHYLSKREVDTVTPLAHRLGLVVDDSFDHEQVEELGQSILGNTTSTLIAWHHGSMVDVLSRFPITNIHDVPAHWPEDRFDLIWVLERKAGEQMYQFTSVDQGLLDGDQISA
jgi:broad specificity phosphatase PhoE